MYSETCHHCGGPSVLKYCGAKCRNRASNERKATRFRERKAARRAERLRLREEGRRAAARLRPPHDGDQYSLL